MDKDVLLTMIPNRPMLNFVLACMVLLAILPVNADDAKMKVGFIYVGPISDYGYTRAADDGRLEAQKELPWIETSYVESVSEGDVEGYIDQMVDQGIKVIFLTSTSFSDGGYACASRYPNVLFFNASGYKTAPNLAIYQADTYQCAYLQGLAAGAISVEMLCNSPTIRPPSIAPPKLPKPPMTITTNEGTRNSKPLPGSTL